MPDLLDQLLDQAQGHTGGPDLLDQLFDQAQGRAGGGYDPAPVPTDNPTAEYAGGEVDAPPPSRPPAQRLADLAGGGYVDNALTVREPQAWTPAVQQPAANVNDKLALPPMGNWSTDPRFAINPPVDLSRVADAQQPINLADLYNQQDAAAVDRAALARDAANRQAVAGWFERRAHLFDPLQAGDVNAAAELNRLNAADPYPQDAASRMAPTDRRRQDARRNEYLDQPAVAAVANQRTPGWNVTAGLATSAEGVAAGLNELAAKGNAALYDVASQVTGDSSYRQKGYDIQRAARGESDAMRKDAQFIRQQLPQTTGAELVTGGADLAMKMGAGTLATLATRNPKVGAAVFMGLFSADAAGNAVNAARQRGASEQELVEDAMFSGMKAALFAKLPGNWGRLARETVATQMAGAYVTGSVQGLGDQGADEAWRAIVRGEKVTPDAIARVGTAFLHGGAVMAGMHGAGAAAGRMGRNTGDSPLRAAEPPVPRPATMDAPAMRPGDYGGAFGRAPERTAPESPRTVFEPETPVAPRGAAENAGTPVGVRAPLSPAQDSGLRTQDSVNRKPLYEMSGDELDAQLKIERSYDRALVARLFGPDAGKYNRASRVANGDGPNATKAYAEVQAMESRLTDAQRDELFGINQPERPSIPEIEGMRNAIGRLDDIDEAGLGRSLAKALTDIGDATDPAKMTPTQQQAYAMMREAMGVMHERGMNEAKVMETAVRVASRRFSDPEDAAFMLKRWMRPRDESVPEAGNRSDEPRRMLESNRDSTPTPGAAAVTQSADTPKSLAEGVDVVDKAFVDRFKDAKGALDMGQVSDAISDTVRTAIARGDTVTLHNTNPEQDGRKVVPITSVNERGMMVRGDGLPQGAFGIARGGQRLEIRRAAPAADKKIAPAGPMPVHEPGAQTLANEPTPPPKATPSRRPVKLTKPRAFSRTDVENRLIQSFDEYDGENATGAALNAETRQDSGTDLIGPGKFTFYKSLPTEVKQFMQGRPEMRRVFRVSDQTMGAEGADAMHAMGENYWKAAEQIAQGKGSKIADAVRFAKGNPDPQMQILAAIHENMPPAKHRGTIQTIDPSTKPPGTKFKLWGSEFEIVEHFDENGEGHRLLKDGDEYPVLPADGVTAMPVDKGSVKEGSWDDPEQQGGFLDGIDDGPPAAPTSDSGVFGQEILRPATGNKQGGLFHEPVEVKGAGESAEDARIRGKFADGGEATNDLFVPADPDSGDVAGMYAGEEGAARMGAERVQARRAANEMTQAGVDPEKVRLATGWFKNPYDGKWRYEIDDSGMKLKKSPGEIAMGTDGFLGTGFGSRWRTLEEVIDHPKLFEAYPQLRKLQVVGTPGSGDASYSPKMGGVIKVDPTSPRLERFLLHEIQHAVQEIEGFARGAKLEGASRAAEQFPSDDYRSFYDDPTAYLMHAGEIEARDVEARAGKDEGGRQSTRPLSSENVPPEQAITRTAADGPVQSRDDVSAAPSHAFRQPTQMAGGAQAIVKARDLIAQVEKVTGTPFRVGHGMFRQRKAAGWFRRSTDVVRQQTAEELDVAYHEAGHAIHAKVIGWNTPWPAGVATELQSMGRELYGTRKPNGGYRREGLAEYVARDLLGDPDLATAAPATKAWWEGTVLKHDAKFAKEYGKLKEMAAAWNDQGAIARVAGKIHELDRGWKGKLNTAYEKVSSILSPYAWTNDGHPLEKSQKRLLRDRGVDAKTILPVMNPATMRQALKMTAPGTARHFIETAAVNPRGERVGPSLKDAIAGVKDDLPTFVAYGTARRAVDLHARGIESGISRADAEYVVKNYETPERKAASDAITTWAGHLMDYVVDAGGLSREAADAMRLANPVYLPFKRYFDENSLGGGGGGGRGGLVNQGSAVKAIKGSGRSIIDPLESLALQAEHMISLGNKARVARSIVDLAEAVGKAGSFAEKVDLSKHAKSFEVEDVRRQLEALGADLSAVNMDELLTVISQPTQYSGKDNIVTIWRDGKREFWELAPDVYKTVTEMDKDHVPTFLRFLAAPARVVRLGATALRPAFQIANMVKDAVTASVLGKGLRTPLASVRGIAADWAGKPEAERWKALGGGMTTIMGQDRASARRTLEESLASGVKGKAIQAAKHPIDAVRSLFEVGEAGPRINEFRRALAEAEGKYGKGSESAAIEALLASKEITVDFTRQGVIGAIANQFIPFFNARIQGTSRLYRALSSRETALPVMAKGLAWLTVPSLALWMVNKDEEWWKELPDYERANNWHFSLDGGKTIRKVPVPESLGKLFGTSPVSIIDGRYRKDPQRVSEGVFELVKSFLPVGSPTEMLSAYAKPGLEVAMNYDGFRARPIVPEHLANQRLPKDQYAKWTTHTAREIGKWLNVSPMKVEHLISGYTGGLGLDLAKWAEVKAGVREPRPSEEPILSRFNTRSPVGRGETVERFYTQLKDLRQKKGSKELSGDEVRQLKLLERRSEVIAKIRDQMDAKSVTEEDGLRRIQDLASQGAK